MGMTLEDVYEYLATGELAQVIMGSELDADASKVPKHHYQKLRNAVQLGLTDLHKRFLLREETLYIDTSSGPGTYILNNEYAESNVRSTQINKYIKDFDAPFQNNLLKVAKIKDAEGMEIPMELTDSNYTIRTLRSDRIELGSGITTPSITLKYHADHPVINKYLADSAPQTINIELGATYLGPLTLFVASRVMNPIGLSNEFHEGNNYFSKYLASIQDIAQQGLDIRQITDNDRFTDNGFI